MIKNMREAIHKLCNTYLLASTAYLFCNAYLIKEVYFGCRVMLITSAQEKILQKICEPVVVRKLKLSKKFQRKVLYVRNSTLRVGLLAPRTITNVLLLNYILVIRE